MANYDPIDMISDLEARQDDLIRQIDHLNDRIEAALAEFSPPPRTIESQAG